MWLTLFADSLVVTSLELSLLKNSEEVKTSLYWLALVVALLGQSSCEGGAVFVSPDKSSEYEATANVEATANSEATAKFEATANSDDSKIWSNSIDDDLEFELLMSNSSSGIRADVVNLLIGGISGKLKILLSC